MSWLYDEDEIISDTYDILAEADRLAAQFDIGAIVQVPDHIDVAAIREGLGLSRQKLANKIGVHVETLRKWETGARQPDAAARVLLAMVSADADVVHRTLARLNLRTGQMASPKAL